MRKTALILTLVLIVLSVLPIIAFAANENEAAVTITYTKEASPPALPPATYEINIPATVEITDINTFTEFFVTASNVNLSEEQSVVVYIDGDSFDDGYLQIKNSNNDIIHVSVRLRYDETIIVLTPNDIVAKFDHNGIPSGEYGAVVVVPFQDEVNAAPPGTYTGTLYFKIAVVDE